MPTWKTLIKELSKQIFWATTTTKMEFKRIALLLIKSTAAVVLLIWVGTTVRVTAAPVEVLAVLPQEVQELV